MLSFSLYSWRDTDEASLELEGSWKVSFIPEPPSLLSPPCSFLGHLEKSFWGSGFPDTAVSPRCDYRADFISGKEKTLNVIRSPCCLEKRWAFILYCFPAELLSIWAVPRMSRDYLSLGARLLTFPWSSCHPTCWVPSGWQLNSPPSSASWANLLRILPTPSSSSLMKILNKTGPSNDSWGTPVATGFHLDFSPPFGSGHSSTFNLLHNEFVKHKVISLSNPNSSLKSWIWLEFKWHLYDDDMQWWKLPGQGLPTFYSSGSSSLVQDGVVSVPSASQTPAYIGDICSCQ